MPERTWRVGLISDTHGLVRREALAALAGSDHIVHAGDIVEPGILALLAKIAPLTAVRGNNDRGAWADALDDTETLELGGVKLFVIHDLKQLGRQADGCDIVIAGHSHQPKVERRDAMLFVNPGSAGPRRFKLPVTVGRLVIEARDVRAEIVQLA
jgi:uncharacterized protein